MSPLELKIALKALEARVSALEALQKESSRKTLEAAVTVATQLIDSAALASKPLEPAKVEQNVEKATGKKLCPKCNKKPAYFFHVKHCPGP